MKPNGAWNEQQPKITLEAPQGLRGPQIGPRTDNQASADTQASPESFTRWLRSLPWWVWALVGIYVGAWLNKH